MKTKNALRSLAGAVVLQLGLLAGSAQTYIYTYTGNDFTSVFNAAGEGFYGGVPYTTSSHITGYISFSAPLGDNYSGNPSATLLSYNFTDEVGPQNAAGDTSGGLGFPYVMDSTFGTDSSGDIVSWNFAVTGFSPSGTLTKGIQTENDSDNVVDSGNFVQEGVIEGEGSVSSDPGTWVETIVPAPEPSVGTLFVSFAALLFAFMRFKPSPPRPEPSFAEQPVAAFLDGGPKGSRPEHGTQTSKTKI
jgi:hypothetical protein